MKKIRCQWVILGLLCSTAILPAQGAELSCDDYYYGLGTDQNFEKAFRCSLERDDMMLLVLMYLNGEGTPVDLDEAEAVLNKDVAESKGSGMGPNATQSTIQEIIDSRRKNPKVKHPRLEYGEIAMTTIDMNDNAIIQSRIEEQAAMTGPPVLVQVL